MLKNGYSAIYVINILVSSVLTLLIYVGLFVLGAWLLVSRLNVGEWVYVVAVLLGVGLGIISMLKFILTSMKTLERIDEEREDKGDL